VGCAAPPGSLCVSPGLPPSGSRVWRPQRRGIQGIHPCHHRLSSRVETNPKRRWGALHLLDLYAFRQDFRLPVVASGVLREEGSKESIHVITGFRRWHRDVKIQKTTVVRRPSTSPDTQTNMSMASRITPPSLVFAGVPSTNLVPLYATRQSVYSRSLCDFTSPPRRRRRHTLIRLPTSGRHR
jgi:hypothetical protein